MDQPEDMAENDKLYPKARSSKSAEAALRAEIRRMEEMTIEERIRAALSLAHRISGISDSSQGSLKNIR